MGGRAGAAKNSPLRGAEAGWQKFLEIDGLETNRPWMDPLFEIQSRGGRLLLRWELPTEVVLALA